MHNENKKGDTIYQGVVEEDIVVGGEGTNTTGGLGGVKAGHSRFFCEKCQSVCECLLLTVCCLLLIEHYSHIISIYFFTIW